MSILRSLFSAKVVSRSNTDQEERIRQLHMSATQNIKEGDLEVAIGELSEAQELMPQVATEYPISQYLRLPVTLQKAGRFSESLEEFERLLEASAKPYHKSNVYDKMRLTCQREDEHQQAVEYGILCLAWECIALNEQNRDYSFLVKEPEQWTKSVSKSLKKLGKEETAKQVQGMGITYAREPSDMAASMLVLEVRGLLQAQ